METDKLQAQRFELKYMVPESVALAARDFVRSYLIPDDFSQNSPDFSYPVHSLYLDSQDLTFYEQTINGDKNRYKLRVRFYDDAPDSPVFFEIKRRTNNTISKQRCGVRRPAIEQILHGHIPPAEFILSKSPSNYFALQNFIELMSFNHAKSLAHVAYRREAWVSAMDNSVRVTMDRKIRFEAQSQPIIATAMKNPVSVFGDEVVLELKFTNRFPNWFKELVRALQLTQGSAAKYAEGLTLYGKHRFQSFVTSGAIPPFLSALSATLWGEVA